MRRWSKVGEWWLRAVIALGTVYGPRWVFSALGVDEAGNGGGVFDRQLDAVIGFLTGPWMLGLAWTVAAGFGLAGLVEFTKREGGREHPSQGRADLEA